MKKNYRKWLVILLPVLACILVLQAAVSVGAEFLTAEGNTIDTKGATRVKRNVPGEKNAFIQYVRGEIEKEKEANGAVSNDALTDLFMACDSEGYVHLTRDGEPYLTVADGSRVNVSELTSGYVSRVTNKVYRQMIEIGETYKDHAADLKYGNYYTPFNETTTNHIDCSSFVQLVLYGIPYETSRYATAEDVNTPRYDFGISLPENPYDDDFGPDRYLANELGHYAFDHDFAYYPNADATNMQPGDILFFSTNKNNEGYFMNITHVGICIERRGEDIVYVLHGNNNDTCNYYEIRLFSPTTVKGSKNAYENSLVLAARFPVQADDSAQ